VSAEVYFTAIAATVIATLSFSWIWAVLHGAYIVGCLYEKVDAPSKDPRWHVIAIRWRFKSALKECMKSDAYFYIPIKLGRLPSSAQAVFPRRA